MNEVIIVIGVVNIQASSYLIGFSTVGSSDDLPKKNKNKIDTY